MSAQPEERYTQLKPWIVRAVFALDRTLRRHQGIYEYTGHRECLFRVEQGCADQSLCLRDGAWIHRGDPILKLHLWNEQVPAMGRQGATIGWACRVHRAVEVSLRELARHLRERRELHRFAAICADMRLASTAQTRQLVQIAARYGFEDGDSLEVRPNALHRFGEIILICMLVLATNPAALRSSTLRRGFARVYLSRATLERRYGPTHATREPTVRSWRDVAAK
jgi:hypothetical protein